MEKEERIIEMSEITVKSINTDSVGTAVEESTKVQQAVEAIDLKDQESYDSIAGIRKTANAKAKELDAERKKITTPLDEAKKQVMSLFNKPIGICKEIVQTCDTMMITWTDLQDRARRKEQARLDEIAEKKRITAEEKAEKAREEGNDTKAEKYEEKAAEVIAPVAQERTEKPKGVSYITRWHGDVTNIKILPMEYIMPDYSKINKVIAATKGTLVIPGVKITSTKTISTRS